MGEPSLAQPRGPNVGPSIKATIWRFRYIPCFMLSFSYVGANFSYEIGFW